MIHDRANELLIILSELLQSDLDVKISSSCRALVNVDVAIVMIKLKQIHTKYKHDSTVNYPHLMQYAVELCIIEMEAETTHIQLDKAANE